MPQGNRYLRLYKKGTVKLFFFYIIFLMLKYKYNINPTKHYRIYGMQDLGIIPLTITKLSGVQRIF